MSGIADIVVRPLHLASRSLSWYLPQSLGAKGETTPMMTGKLYVSATILANRRTGESGWVRTIFFMFWTRTHTLMKFLLRYFITVGEESGPALSVFALPQQDWSSRLPNTTKRWMGFFCLRAAFNASGTERH